jgi:hypothetical protein
VAVAATVLAKETGTKIVAVGTVLVEAVEKASAKAMATVAPPVSVASAEPVAKPVAAPVAVPVVAPVVVAAPKPVMPRPVRVHTDQERLLLAGQTAFGTNIPTPTVFRRVIFCRRQNSASRCRFTRLKNPPGRVTSRASRSSRCSSRPSNGFSPS